MTTVVTLTWMVIAPLIAAALTPTQIVIWLTLIPYLFLPEAFSIYVIGLPDIDKSAAISIGLLLSFVTHYGKFAAFSQTTSKPTAVKIVVLTCSVMIVVGAFMTMLTNREPLLYGATMLPGMRLWDSISFLSSIFFFMFPFFLATRYLRTPAAQQELLAAFVVMALLYSLLMLIEIRLSPQLHKWIYGYHQHSFLQHIRNGYRPMVFLYHGIWVGFFMFMAVMAALGLWKATRKPKWILSAIWLFLILGISRNLGATAICILLSSLFLFTGPRFQATFAASIALLVLFYPGSRQANLIPTHQIVSVAAFVSENRAQSLEFRIENEDLLLARAFQKPLFGWGLYSREQIFDEFGRRISISEGRWIQTIGQSGWFGYIALFSILVFPVLFLCAKRTILKPTPETFALTLIITGNLIYMIPNSTLTPIGWLVFGSLAGFLYTVGESPASSVPARPKIRYTRFPHNSFDDNI